ncbi:MAG TPA: M23 family metallopeptidase, partial [Anaerolineales bacterium]
MKRTLPIFLANLLLSILVSSCGTSGYWIPPYSTPTVLPGLAFLAETAAPEPTDPPVQPQPSATPSQDPPAAFTPTAAANPATEPPLILKPSSTPSIASVNTAPILYYTQAADSLPVVAVRFGVTLTEITSPDPIPQKAFINPGQLLIIPRRLANTTSSKHLLPDSEVVFSPSAIDFDVAAYAKQAGGRLSGEQDWLKGTGIIPGTSLLLRVATENSINPRLLLALMEYQTQWLTSRDQDRNQVDYPIGLVDPSQQGLYRQLVWAVNELSIGYYAYREGRLTEINFPDGMTARLAPDLNAGTAALQYFFAQLYQGQRWLDALDPVNGFPALYTRMFGDPWARAQTVEPLYPPDLTQPPLVLPFARNWQWSFTGGPHGAWEYEGAYAALDFAPGSSESGCVKSDAWEVAAASGLVVRSDSGVVVIDLDGDGHEQTGWVLMYLHVAEEGQIAANTWVDAGTPIGHPSCEGGISTGTHLHIARKYNG